MMLHRVYLPVLYGTVEVLINRNETTHEIFCETLSHPPPLTAADLRLPSVREVERTRLNPVRHKSRGSKGKQKRW